MLRHRETTDIQDIEDKELKMNTPALFLRFVAGDPLVGPEAIASALEHADGVVLDLPFSDPIAVPPALEAAHDRALSRGTRIEDALEVVRRVKAATGKHVIVPVVSNLAYVNDFDRLTARIRAAGADEVMLPDVPVVMREAEPVWEATAQVNEIPLTVSITPTQTKAGFEKALAHAADTLLISFTPTSKPFGVLANENLPARVLVETPAFEGPFKAAAAELVGKGPATGIILETEPVTILSGNGPAEGIEALERFLGDVRAALA